jgi:hypothetical protein
LFQIKQGGGICFCHVPDLFKIAEMRLIIFNSKYQAPLYPA